MRILLLTHAFNSLTQRLFVELRDEGHEVSVEFDINDSVSRETIDLYEPDLIVAPFLKRAIPEDIWRNHLCLIVHPGIKGDRGPSALDWAVLGGEDTRGVTVLQAIEEMDAGDIWASVNFPTRDAPKASLYRDEAASAAVKGVLLAIEKLQEEGFTPEPLDYSNDDVKGQLRPLMKQADRAIDWQLDTTEHIIRKINSADGFPGLKDEINGKKMFLFNTHFEPELTGVPGDIIATCGTAICRATTDGALWIGHLRDPEGQHPFKLPATHVLADEIDGLPEKENGCPEIIYEEEDACGYLYFNFYNGAMGTAQCEQLLEAYQDACQRDTKVIVLMGGRDFWSNGMNLNLIEAADSPADESWRNINAIDDVSKAIIETESHVTVSALGANAGAGGVFLARAADRVFGRPGVILNPHYKDMGNLYGSEYWTYLLPKCCGEEKARQISQARLPMGMTEAKSLGLVDAIVDGDFQQQVRVLSQELAVDAENILEEKVIQRARDEAEKPLAQYREEELKRMHQNFYGFDPSYHVARYNFVYKVVKSRTPLTIASHRKSRKKSQEGGLKKVS